MSTETNCLAHRWFEEVWNKGNADVIDQLTTHDIIGHGLKDPAGNEITGADAFKAFYQQFRGAFPDIHIAILETVQQGGKTAVLCRVTATHAGDGLGIPATHRKVDYNGICLIRERDGMIAESWNCFDFLSMLQQIGVVTPPKLTAAAA